MKGNRCLLFMLSALLMTALAGGVRAADGEESFYDGLWREDPEEEARWVKDVLEPWLRQNNKEFDEYNHPWHLYADRFSGKPLDTLPARYWLGGVNTDADIAKLSSLPGLRRVRLSSRGISDRGITRLATAAGVESLILDGGIFDKKDNDEAVGYLSSLGNLKELHPGFAISEKGLERIGLMTNLRALSLSRYDAAKEPPPESRPRRKRFNDMKRLFRVPGNASEKEAIKVIVAKMPPLPPERAEELKRMGKTLGEVLLLELEEEDRAVLSAMKGLSPLAALDRLEYLALPDCSLNERNFGEIAALRSLRSLNLNRTRIVGERPACYAELEQLPRLEVLRLSKPFNTHDTSRHFLPLTEFPSLRELSFQSESSISDEDLRDIAQCQGLRKLDLTWCEDYSDKGVAELAKLPSLEELDLTKPRSGDVELSDFGLEDLAGAASLRRLTLANHDMITDLGVEALGALKNLEYLDLSGCRNVTGEAIKTLSSLPKLRELNLSNCDVTVLDAADWGKFPALEALNAGQGIPLTLPLVMALGNVRTLRRLIVADDSALNEGYVLYDEELARAVRELLPDCVISSR